MDPEATLERILQAIADGDADELREAADDLANWIDDDGYVIDSPKIQSLLAVVESW